MAWQPGSISVLAFIAGAFSGILAVLGWRYRGESGAKWFTGLMVAAGGWSLIYGIQLGYGTVADQLLWQRLGLAIGGTIPTLWFLFTLQYAGLDEWVTHRRLGLLAIDPFGFALLTLSNPLHGLAWSSATLEADSAVRIVDLIVGPGYLVHIGYAYLLVASGIAVLLGVFFRASTLYRKQTGLLVLGALPPFTANIAFTLQLVWESFPPLDLTPFAFTLTGIAFGLALFQFDLLERTPVAREQMIEEMGDGLVVLNADGEVVSSNSVATDVLDPSPTVGQPIAVYFPNVDGELHRIDGTTVTADRHGSERIYDVSVSMLPDHRGQPAGYVVALRDATDRHAYEQRLEVANRVLRHNLRNDMNVIHGFADQVISTSDGEAVEAANRIKAIADDLTDLSDKARTMVETSERISSTPKPVEISGLLEETIRQYRKEQPAFEFDIESPDEVWVALPHEELFTIALSNLVENAIEHHNTDNPWVRVSVLPAEDSSDRVRIRVADNGPGIPDTEREVLKEGAETPLQHGSGLGLWLVHWAVSAGGGTVRFDESDSQGSVVTLEFKPAAPPEN